MSLSPELLQILVCPKCKSSLDYYTAPAEVLACRTCALVYAVQDGIPVMLIDEARPLDATVYPPKT
ncbi:MAG: Trm112 family protein [Gemmatimonadota bacterium]|nr:Trm112 family protein [Gemmatimonadota bacterium]